MGNAELHKYIKKISIEDFSGHLGNSFLYKLHLIDKLIGNNHHPSVGAYKESLIVDALKQYIPDRYSVGTGFALFAPITRFDINSDDEFELSDQLDIIVYDNFSIPTIYKDNNFVILRPEAIKCIIEVKGSAHSADIVGSRSKNGKKTKIGTIEKCQLYKQSLKKYNDEVYKNHINNPGLDKKLKIKQPLKNLNVKYYLFCWDIYKNEIGVNGIIKSLKKVENSDELIDGVYRYQKWMLYKEKNGDEYCYNEHYGYFTNSIGQLMDKSIWDLIHNVLYFLTESQENLAYDNIKVRNDLKKRHQLSD
jgi:hypothetical protein